LEYFEQANVWDNEFRDNPDERQRIKETIDAIPSDAQSILDVGCGSGVFLNTLISSKAGVFNRIAGLDVSSEALKQLKCEAYQSSVKKMPFKDKSFDIVTCLEVLEHLNNNELPYALSEIERISRKHILLTVPNEEDLMQNLVICPKCFCCFSPWYHVRSFHQKDLIGLFPSFRLITNKTIGPITERIVYHHAVRGMQLLWSRPVLPAHCICPQCHYLSVPETAIKNGHSSMFRKFALKLAKNLCGNRREKKKWLLAHYVRNNLSQT